MSQAPRSRPWISGCRRVAFLGDSLTQGGWEKPDGWVRTVVDELGRQGTVFEVVPAGIGGHQSVDMLERLDRDVLSHQPDAVLLSCGVNDVWRGPEGVSLADFRAHVTAIVQRCQASGARVAILTATIIGEHLDGEENGRLEGYNRFLREFAASSGALLVDCNAAFQDAVRQGPGTGDHLTDDGVHFNPRGEQVMAAAVLGAISAPGP